MKIIELDQQGELWLKWREAGLGSSDASIIMGVSPYADAPTLYRRKRTGYQKQQDNAAQARGHRLEPIARELYQRATGIHTRPVCVIHDDFDWLRASLDGLSDDNQTILEIKAIRAEYHLLALQGTIPPLYLPQVQHQLLATGLKTLHYWSYSESTKFPLKDRVALVEVLPDREYQMDLFARERAFWESVQEGKPDTKLMDYWKKLSTVS